MIFTLLIYWNSISPYLVDHHRPNVLPKGRSFTASAGAQGAVLRNAGLPPQAQEPRLQFYQELNRCGSFPLLSASHSLFSIWTDLRRSEKTPGAPMWRWREWIWLTGPYGLHRNSSQGLNISSTRVFDQIRDPEIRITLRPYVSFRMSYWGKAEVFDVQHSLCKFIPYLLLFINVFFLS